MNKLLILLGLLIIIGCGGNTKKDIIKTEDTLKVKVPYRIYVPREYEAWYFSEYPILSKDLAYITQ